MLVAAALLAALATAPQATAAAAGSPATFKRALSPEYSGDGSSWMISDVFQKSLRSLQVSVPAIDGSVAAAAACAHTTGLLLPSVRKVCACFI